MRFRFVLLLAVVAFAPGRAAGQLRIVNYNTANAAGTAGPRAGIGTILSAVGTDARNGIARPIDVLVLIESTSSTTTGQAFVDLLNGVYGAGTYARGSLNGTSTGNGTTSVVYRTASVQLVGEQAVDTISGTTAGARETLRYQFRPAGYTAAADFYVYGSHYKANDTTEDAARRGNEAAVIRANADALGTGARAIYAGDLNFYRPTEAGYTALTGGTNTPGKAFDPAFAGTSWSGTANRALHTQSPATTQAFDAQVLGGMNDRFDFQLVTDPMRPGGRGVAQVAGSYRAFGNNGTHSLGGAITTGTGAAANVLTALAQVSDHLPLVADYQIPARLSASVIAPTRVIRGTTANVSLSVTNSAAVATANGADVLDYTFAGTGAVVGSGSRFGLAALAAAQANTLTVPTTAAGTYTGTATATGTSPGVANGAFSQAVSVLALDPANGSFAATDADTQAIDFGTAVEGQTVTRRFSVFNLASANGASLTARLRLVGTTEQVPGGPFTVAFDPFTGDLNPGSDRGGTVTFAANTAGAYSDTFTFQFADEDIPGATPQTLTLTVSGTFTPVPEPAGLLLVGVLLIRRRIMPG